MNDALEVLEHASGSYPPRTRENASKADLTVAFAVDFDTHGERLTRKAAGTRYVAISLDSDPIEAARILYAALRRFQATTLNVAGNSLPTLLGRGWTQARADQFVLDVLATCSKHWKLDSIRSGGQTGIDLAGVTAACILGIPAIALLPKGFLQRGADNKDFTQDAQSVRRQIESGVERLKQSNLPQAEPEPLTGSIQVVSKRAGGVKPDANQTVISADRTNPVLGNPFHLRDWRNPAGRHNVIERYRKEVLLPDLAAQGPIYRALEDIKARVKTGEHIALACWCAPLPCHADHLKAYIEGDEPNLNQKE